MIEGSWGRQLYGIPTFPHLHTAPPRVSANIVAGKFGGQPTSVDTTLSGMVFVSEEHGNTADRSDPGLYPSPCSPISEIKFASPEESMTLATFSESELSSRDSLSFSTTDSSSPGVHDDQTRITSNERSSLTTHTTSISQQQPAWVTPRFDGPATLDCKRVGRRPLPEVPEHAQPRPLPPRPIRIATVPGWRGPDRFSYPPRQELVQGCSSDPSTASRPVSNSGPDTPGGSAEEERPNRDPTPEDTPHEHLIPAPPTMISSPTTSLSHPPLSPPSPILPLRIAESVRPSADVLSPTSIDLVTAAGLTIIGENGEQISFGALFGDRKVIVVFICYFWCLCCQHYARSILNSVTPEILEHKGVDLVVIGNGAPGPIKVYKSMPRCVFRGPQS